MISPARFALLHIRLSSHLYQPVYFSNFSATLGAGPDSCLSLVSHLLSLHCRKGAGEARTTRFVYSFQLTGHCQWAILRCTAVGSIVGIGKESTSQSCLQGALVHARGKERTCKDPKITLSLYNCCAAFSVLAMHMQLG